MITMNKICMDVTLHIFSFLPVTDQVRLSSTCKWMRGLFDDYVKIDVSLKGLELFRATPESLVWLKRKGVEIPIIESHAFAATRNPQLYKWMIENGYIAVDKQPVITQRNILNTEDVELFKTYIKNVTEITYKNAQPTEIPVRCREDSYIRLLLLQQTAYANELLETGKIGWYDRMEFSYSKSDLKTMFATRNHILLGCSNTHWYSYEYILKSAQMLLVLEDYLFLKYLKKSKHFNYFEEGSYLDHDTGYEVEVFYRVTYTKADIVKDLIDYVGACFPRERREKELGRLELTLKSCLKTEKQGKND